MIPRSEAPYKSCYCEENVYQLLKLLIQRRVNENSNLYAVLISNDIKQIPLWSQKASEASGSDMVIWDYHVIAIEQEKGLNAKTVVFDMDTTLDWPEDFEKYWQETMNPDYGLREKYERVFRVIPVETYLEIFWSDREHMKNADGSWKMPPPSWPMILSESERKASLMELIDMRRKIGRTDVMNEREFHKFFTKS